MAIEQLAAGKWFSPSEFACHDAIRTPYPISWPDRWVRLRDLCDAIRSLWGGPLIVVSGYRTPEHNMDLMAADDGAHGVASSSKHLNGEAADLRTTRGPVDVPQLLRVIMNGYRDGKLPELGGVGDYPRAGWCHVDTFKAGDGHLRRWSQR